MPGSQGHAVHGENAEVLDHDDRAVVSTRAGAGDDDQQVAHGGGLKGRPADTVVVVGLDREHDRLTAGLFGQRGQHERVRIVELALREAGPDRTYVVAGGQHSHDRFAADEDPAMPAAPQAATSPARSRRARALR